MTDVTAPSPSNGAMLIAPAPFVKAGPDTSGLKAGGFWATYEALGIPLDYKSDGRARPEVEQRYLRIGGTRNFDWATGRAYEGAKPARMREIIRTGQLVKLDKAALSKPDSELDGIDIYRFGGGVSRDTYASADFTFQCVDTYASYPSLDIERGNVTSTCTLAYPDRDIYVQVETSTRALLHAARIRALMEHFIGLCQP